MEEDKIREESNDNHVEEEISQGDNAEEPATEQEVGENDEGEESNDGNEEVIPETQQDKYTDIATLGFIAGFIIMMMLDVALG